MSPFCAGTWTATAGAHVLRVQADDINRVPGEKSETNNDDARSLMAGDSPHGLLLGANQKLLVTWALEGEPNRFAGQARLQAATLATAR